MTALTMEQRRADFEAMLKRANRMRAAGQKRREMYPEADGLMLARLTEEVSTLCYGWHEAAHRATTGVLAPYTVGQVTKSALQVAAHCLAALRDRDPEGDLAPIREMGHQLNDRDLGVDPAERIGWLLSTLGDLGTCYHRNLDPNGSITVFRLRSLAVESLCAALAAERGLWQEKS